MIDEMSKRWEDLKYIKLDEKDDSKPEGGLLKLNCDKAVECLNWRPVLTFSETMDFVVDWYKDYASSPNTDTGRTNIQIDNYVELARSRELSWAV